MSEQEWHDWRAGGLGASDIGALLGLSRFDSPWSLWARKVGLRQPTEATYSQQRGHDFEPVLAKLFTRETGLYVAGEQTWCANPAEPWMRCTVDGFVFDGAQCIDEPGFENLTMADALGGFEAKTDGRFAWPEGVPPQYEAQAKWSMAVTGMERWWIAVLFAGWRFEVHEITRDAEDEAFMVERARAFWTDHVLTGEAPPTDGSDATLDALAEVYPQHVEDKAIELDEDCRQAMAQFEAAKSGLKEWARQRDEAKARLEAFLGEAEEGTIDGQRVVSWRTQHRSAYTVDEADIRVMRTHQPKKEKTHVRP